MQSYKIQDCKVATIATTKYSMLEKLQDYKFACYVVAGLWNCKFTTTKLQGCKVTKLQSCKVTT